MLFSLARDATTGKSIAKERGARDRERVNAVHDPAPALTIPLSVWHNEKQER
jgi:hypothetical protein